MSSPPAVAGDAGVYVHIPFCRAKCAYCDFSSYCGLERLFPSYLTAIQGELDLRAPTWATIPFRTLYVGGGTPTLLGADRLTQLLQLLQTRLRWQGPAEVTVEANPGTVDPSLLGKLRAAGYDRLSLGVQSFRADELRLLGRIHSAEEAVRALGWAREAGFGNVNLDLIYGLPCQTLAQWRESLEQAIEAYPEHLSLYALTLEETTPLARAVAQGVLASPDDDLVADMYEWAEARLQTAGYTHYEISNWARSSREDRPGSVPALASRHNLIYWRNERYLGLGAAAYSYDGAQPIAARSGNVRRPEEYIRRILAGEEPTEETEQADAQRQIEDTLMLGLRLVEGVHWEALRQRFGTDLRGAYSDTLEELVADGLLQVDDDGMRLTARGRLLGNRVFAAFLR